ncbi:MAG: hypothetical protein NTX64_08900 [Elusimicrobia bacterium]|nr:hypothetical protein [Elusimicrobiota bacterium]
MIETLNLIPRLKGLRWRAFVGHRTPPALLRRFRGRAERIAGFSARALARLGARLKCQGYSAAVINVLRADANQVRAFQQTGIKTACLTASGRPPACADAALAYDAALWNKLPGGPRHQCLAPAYARLARRERRHAGGLRDVMIIMGGTDTSGTTLNVLASLASWAPRVRKHVVAGPNFIHRAKLKRLLSRLDGSFILHESPSHLPALMRRVDAALTLGSDTALELACVGTPTLLFHEAPHEARVARLFAKKGCGLYIGSRRAATPKRLAGALAKLQDPRARDRMARAGRRLVDGRGAERLAALIRRLAA